MRMAPNDRLRAQYAADAKKITLRMRLFVHAANPPVALTDPEGRTYVDGRAGERLCGDDEPRENDSNFVGEVADDELSRILWENFPNRCPECVRLDTARNAS